MKRKKKISDRFWNWILEGNPSTLKILDTQDLLQGINSALSHPQFPAPPASRGCWVPGRTQEHQGSPCHCCSFSFSSEASHSSLPALARSWQLQEPLWACWGHLGVRNRWCPARGEGFSSHCRVHSRAAPRVWPPPSLVPPLGRWQRHLGWREFKMNSK